VVPYPKKKNEFELQVEVYNALKAKNLDVRGEVKLKFHRRRGARFDLVVFKNKKALAVIEVKDGERHNPNQEHSKAGYYFDISQVPQYTFYSNDNLEFLVSNIEVLASQPADQTTVRSAESPHRGCGT